MTTADIALEIDNELGDENSYSQEFIEQWLKDNIGQLNNLTRNSISVADNGSFDPEITVDESVIFKTIFYIWWYDKQIRNLLNGITSSRSNSILSLKDGDSEIKFTNRNEMAKVWRGMKNDQEKALMEMINRYNQNRSTPSAIYGDDTLTSDPYPTTSMVYNRIV